MLEPGQELAEIAAELRDWLRAAGDAGAQGLPAAPRDWHRPAEPDPAPEPLRAEASPGETPRTQRPRPTPARAPTPAPTPARPRAAAPAPAPQLDLGGSSWAAFVGEGTAQTEPEPEAPLDTRFGPRDAVGAWGFAGDGPPLRPEDKGNLDALVTARQQLGDCRRCRLCEGRERLVFGMGNPGADLVIVGEGPGAQEDRQGLPFVGPSGQMLDRMLQHVLELDRTRVYILNVVKCRPPSNRTPHPDEIKACSPFLMRQLEAIQPKVILTMGRPATQTLLDTSRGINALRGRFHLWGPRQVPVMPTYHPAYLLRRPEDKGKTFADLKLLRVRYDELGGWR
ncbi:MAG: uracil-DNA glycosylase [Alphaproteobacteria bacterium]|nr:uracil-DNA glycosylase [Alphaproteobacteria bacterium]MCB9791647.1 uracil-DNA glycosylase [Alphaproteobacteria bacterium]